jgi:uncharacterized protein YdeI (YjbR/CyaY-like superfamily)
MATASAPTYFATPAKWRAWLLANHEHKTELLVGFHKTDSGVPSMTWTESVREALCFGWIDGIRRRVDDQRYTIRFTPRKPSSVWSAVNVRHVEELTAAGLMHPAGLAAFARVREGKTAIYSFEQRTVELPEPHATTFRRAKKAWAWFEQSAPSYRKAAVWWVVSAKREETQVMRLQTLIECSAAGERIPQMRPTR